MTRRLGAAPFRLNQWLPSDWPELERPALDGALEWLGGRWDAPGLWGGFGRAGGRHAGGHVPVLDDQRKP